MPFIDIKEFGDFRPQRITRFGIMLASKSKNFQLRQQRPTLTQEGMGSTGPPRCRLQLCT